MPEFKDLKEIAEAFDRLENRIKSVELKLPGKLERIIQYAVAVVFGGIVIWIIEHLR